MAFKGSDISGNEGKLKSFYMVEFEFIKKLPGKERFIVKNGVQFMYIKCKAPQTSSCDLSAKSFISVSTQTATCWRLWVTGLPWSGGPRGAGVWSPDLAIPGESEARGQNSLS